MASQSPQAGALRYARQTASLRKALAYAGELRRDGKTEAAAKEHSEIIAQMAGFTVLSELYAPERQGFSLFRGYYFQFTATHRTGCLSTLFRSKRNGSMSSVVFH